MNYSANTNQIQVTCRRFSSSFALPFPRSSRAKNSTSPSVTIPTRPIQIITFKGWQRKEHSNIVVKVSTNLFKVGSINSLCQILELFSRTNCKLKRERSELRDQFNLRFEPKRIQKMTKRQPNEQREQKPNLFGLCRVASEEEEFKHKYQAF